MIRYALVGIGILAIIPIAWLAWWLLSPLFMTTEVYEEFPNAARATIPQGMSISDVETTMALAAATDLPVDEAMPSMVMEAETPVQDMIRAAGNFRDADSFHKGSGNATIYELGSGERILRLDEFRVTNGPDLHVIVSPHPNPESQDDLKTPGYRDLGSLKGNQGNQNYPLPEGVSLEDLGSVVIYCAPFHVIFSTASLAEGG